jgi:hypothetical protein
MKNEYYISVRLLKGNEETKTSDMEVIDGTTYRIGTKKQAKEDITYIDTHLNL